MPDFAMIREHMEVVGSDGRHVGTVDCVQAHNIILTKNDPTAGGRHHGIPLDWVNTIGQETLRLNQPADEARANWLNNVAPANVPADTRRRKESSKLKVSLPELVLVAATRGAIGLGAGLLLANKLSPSRRKAIGLPLFIGGLLSTIPIARHLFAKRDRVTG